jgi:hypothetical protein
MLKTKAMLAHTFGIIIAFEVRAIFGHFHNYAELE